MKTTSYDKSSAVVVLPAIGNGRLHDRTLRRWLARAELVRSDAATPLLTRIVSELGMVPPAEGLGALRMWGQTGDRPGTWIAAADPVYLEPRLDDLCLYALPPAALRPSELGALIDHLQARLGQDAQCGFARVGSFGYLTCQSPIATARLAPADISGQSPGGFLPGGAGSAEQRNLLSEIEMALHDHEVNLERQQGGQHVINSFWLWGGGTAPEQKTVPHPPLFADDPLLRGYWLSNTALVEAWPGSIAACLDVAVAGLVAVVPENERAIEPLLGELRDALHRGRLSSLILLFADGLRAEVQKAHRWRVWRLRNTLLESATASTGRSSMSSFVEPGDDESRDGT